MRFICCFVAIVGYMSAVGSAFDLQCSDIYVDVTWKLENVYTCKVTDMYVITKGDTVSLASEELDQVRGIWIASGTAFYVPRFLNSLALLIDAFSLWDCHLKSIERSDLEQFPNLQDLWVNYNDLETLESDLFESSPKLQFITFSRNNLKLISADIFQPLKNFKYAWFDAEGCINFLADTPAELETLRMELIAKCSPQKIAPCNELSLEQEIEEKQLENDQLKVKVDEERTKAEAAERNLQLKTSECASTEAQLQNSIKYFTRRVENVEEELQQANSKWASQRAQLNQKVVEEQNKTIKAEQALQQKTSEWSSSESKLQARISDLDQNLTLEQIKVAKALLLMTSLELLNLTGNICVDLKHPETAFAKVNDAILEKCAIPVVFTCDSNNEPICRANQNATLKTFEGIRAGKAPKEDIELIIEDEIFNYFPDQLAQTYPKLQKLAIRRSQLNVIVKKDFVGLSHLKWIEIVGNNITTISIGAFDAVPQLEYLDLSSNHIQSLPPKIFNRLSLLKELRLSTNEIKILNANILPAQSSIKVFRIDNNSIAEIEANILRALTNSNEIDMVDNACIDAKFQKSDETSSKQLKLFFGEIIMSCTSAE